jgi:UDP-N-acetylglucosamine--N-acetylmuramyl-(pentapeptide) pyrophosphoryl-undecaprenol N-acetylglucosamine transferase
LPKVLIAVSGTGGHVYPGVALAEELSSRRPGLSVVFATGLAKPAAAWLEKEGFEVREVRLAGLDRSRRLSWFAFPRTLLEGSRDALAVLRSEAPNLVIGTGGYVSGPFALGACLYRIPTVILEQNLVPGITTKLSSLFVRQVHVAFAETREKLPRRGIVRVSGNPVRRSIEHGEPARFRARLSLRERTPMILVLGGSQGAEAVSTCAIEAAKLSSEWGDFHMVVQAGASGFERARERARGLGERVKVVDFLTDIGDAYAAATLVVARSGAMTLTELAAVSLPAILVPYPWAAGNHQLANAQEFASGGAARVLLQERLTPEILSREIGEILGNAEILERMREAAGRRSLRGARETIADACEAFLG